MTTNWISWKAEQKKEKINWTSAIIVMALFALFIGVQLYFVIEYFITK